jgi:hypothetical protein
LESGAATGGDFGFFAVAIAAIAAGLLAIGEQNKTFSSTQRLPLRQGAWLYWLQRVLLEAAAAVVVTVFAQTVAKVPNADQWWAGLLGALFSVAGLRSNVFDPGENAYGLRRFFDPFRERITTRLTVAVSIPASGEFQDTLERLIQLGTEPDWVAERVRLFIDALDNLSAAEKEHELQGLEQQVQDVGEDNRTKLEVVLRTARRRGSDDLVKDIVRRAEERADEDTPST